MWFHEDQNLKTTMKDVTSIIMVIVSHNIKHQIKGGGA